MIRFSSFFLLMGGLALGLQARAQAGPSVVGTSARLPIAAVTAAAAASHSSQLPQEEPWLLPALATIVKEEVEAPVAAGPSGTTAAVAASKSQLLLVLLETIQGQQARLDALQTQADAAIRRANRAEAATVAFEQRLRQLESAGSRPGFWR
ncbi:hypothetical protein GCM10022409_06720 [Hymenobacter glaciei]|uniref:Uncharacterized protein n=1 Tax=Hymenobacter glaciei TaxID=877209 RepID=A0ABP7TEZ1_9BACT